MDAFAKTHLHAIDRCGQTMAEYAMILAFVALVAIAAVTVLGGDLRAAFNQIASLL